jgi:adenylylsulfate kinase-like enzyme
MVIWITGMSGSGKTFYANKICAYLKKKYNNIFLIDGDEIRKYITYKLKYSVSDRRKNSKFIQDLCKYLEKKNFLVVCAILSIFPSHQKKNRSLFKKYLQISIKVEKDKLIKRNNKLIYKKKNVVGKKIKYPKPYKPDLLIKNNFDKDHEKNLKKIFKLINAKYKSKKIN